MSGLRNRRAVEALLGLLALELAVVVTSGGASLLNLQGSPSVSALGFLVRAGILALLLGVRLMALTDRRDRARFVLMVLMLPALAQFHFAGGRLGGDGISYYVYTRSLVKDADLDFTNEYDHFGILDRADIKIPTKTGLRRSIFSVGPGIVGIPFFLLGEGVGRLQALAGVSVDLSGYGDVHVHAVALGGFLLGFLAVLFIHALLRAHFGEGIALLSAILVWLATFLHWYMTQQPIMSHVSSACAAAAAVLVWDRGREGRSARGYLLFGLLLGFAMCLRWQNGVLLLLPGLELVRRVAREGVPLKAAVVCAGLLALGTVVGVSPQMLAWKTIYGSYLLEAPPHGADFVRLDHPFILQTLFSSRHGLLSWTPVLWAGFLGFFPLLKRRPALAAPLLVPLFLMTYVNMCSGDWWAGGSFSNRRFDSLLPLLALGMAAAIETFRAALARRPQMVLAMGAAPLILWNATLLEQVRRGLVPRDDTVDGPVLVGQAARLVAEAVGFPTTWPASWVFAVRHDLSPGQYDLLVGRYLFYRQNNLGGRIEIGGEGDHAMLGEGWSRAEREGVVDYRETRGDARVLAPLDVPEDLDVRVRAAAVRGEATAVLSVNGHTVGRFRAFEAFEDHGLRVPRAFWRRELNDVVLVPEGAPLRVDAITFTRIPRRR